MKKIAIITARSGSKGLPNKNVLFANGKPLMAYSIEAALESGEFEKIIVSTDSQEYIDLLSHYPIEFVKRSAELASDKASSFVVIEDVLNKYQHIDFDYFALLQPTSPLRTAQHIQEANAKFEQHFDQFDFLVSVSDAHKPTTLTREIDEDESLKNFKLDYSNYARQQYYSEYSPNGAIFSAKPQAYLKQKHFYGEKCIAYFMDKEVSVDIDDRLDFEYFYFILQQRNKTQILLETIKRTITSKKENFDQLKDISLIGHSILDYWNIETLKQQAVNNLAIAGISTKQYLKLILDKGFIQDLGDKAILMFGTNDIVYDGWSNEQVLADIQKVIDKLKAIKEDIMLYFLEITPVALRVDRDNTVIRELNKYLKANLKGVKWISLDSQFSDQYGKLNLDYTQDGLHLNEQGYQLLKNIVESEL
ncbi:cytidylyltransferase domain-containing protein [Rodentibacter pneumotropicus]|uniref:cytidylyltransferase domain-containing protein n=1 Tax=Rodentibacter pneumotropicus TaxID=758 RepID=UPI00036B870F|nr:GDSL-type esterase/lipase family protein [Rodentibacter pneumotropicus]NBH74438.1 acylneuraminate cytidylyltransferase [Rodentibacter pneumotropicus]OOF63988.1 acylneuraminate cytidylyltransferase [Rodentibacter pneumotropicus]TGZ99252.1 acylneuraminate cytidylyltransferase [Rodentibacter pneumotropicus]THA06755.1 acylneuraminate cytidylyltransferase [Rodentibacter pneumotropicus]THA11990.1 acylneuraminate cytidylyltransferase [Rodentibacter pneumotropicus]